MKLLRSFKRNLSTNSSLTPASINHILKSLQKQAGLNQISELSGHSFRVGAALDLLDKNIPLEKIMLRGGWKAEYELDEMCEDTWRWQSQNPDGYPRHR